MSSFIGFDEAQVKELEKGQEKGLDVHVYADKSFEAERMWCIRNLMERNLAYDEFLNHKLNGEAMYKRYKEIKARK